MPPASDFFSAVVRYRADALAIVLMALLGFLACRNHLRQRGALQYFSDANGAVLIGLVLAGALLADLLSLVLGYPNPPSMLAVSVVRIVTLVMTALVVGLVLWARNRTAQLRAEYQAQINATKQLEQARREAEDANRAKSDFLAVMSHEIRTPLNAVLGFANLLADSRLDEAQRGYVATISTEGSRLSALINDILDLTKIEKGRLILERFPFAPAEVIMEVLRLLYPRAAEKSIDLRFEAILAGPVVVEGDPLRFRQVIVNLVDNAIKFTSRGSVTLFMTWTGPAAAFEPGQLAIRVVDTGVGIPPEKLGGLFQMFAQASPSTTRQFGGTGLGLAISQRLVTLMGGEITVRSKPDEGAEFKFVIPLPYIALPSEAATMALDLPMKPTHAPAVLVVDDLESNRIVLEQLLRRQGFEPHVASTGEQAIRLAIEQRYDLILLDLQLPDIDGYDVARAIRAGAAPGHRPLLIGLTASLNRGTRDKCLAAGMDEQLTKPLDSRKFSLLWRTRGQASTAPSSARQRFPAKPGSSG